MMDPSSVADLGLGDGTSTCAKCGCLCGRGEMSMRSFIGPGEDDGKGGGGNTFCILLASSLPRPCPAQLTTAIKCPEEIRREE